MTVQTYQLSNGYETQYSINYPLTDFSTGTQYLQPYNNQPCNQQVQCSPQLTYVPVFVQPQYSPNFEPTTALCPPNQNQPMPFISLTPSAATANAAPLAAAPVAPLPLQAPSTLLPPVQNAGGLSPVFQSMPISRSPSPAFGPVSSSPAFGSMSAPIFQRTPSPSPSASPRQDVVMQNVVPDLSQCKILYELDIIRHQATTKSIDDNYGGDIADAMRKVLGTEVWYLFVIVAEQEKSMTIKWAVHPDYSNFEALRKLTYTKDFEKRLVCELALVGNGAFNRHLHGSKQLTIISEGWKCFDRLQNALESFNDARNNLLRAHPDDKFDENNVRDLFRVCEAPRGSALRGDSVVGGHFRGGDVLRLNQFLDIVEAKIGTITKATMIPSMKGKAQYKGWSIYIETPSAEHVTTIKEACKMCSFEKAEIFTAVDRFQRRNE